MTARPHIIPAEFCQFLARFQTFSPQTFLANLEELTCKTIEHINDLRTLT